MGLGPWHEQESQGCIQEGHKEEFEESQARSSEFVILHMYPHSAYQLATNKNNWCSDT